MCKNHNEVKNKSNEENSGHAHSSLSTIMFFVGLSTFLVAFIIKSNFELLTNILFIITVITAGYHIIFEGIGDTIRNTKLQGKFSPNVHLLMALATAGAIIIGSYEEAAMLIIIFAGAHFLEEYVDEKSKKEITALLELNPSQARIILDDGIVKVVSLDNVRVGDRLQVLNGDQVPTDGIILEGSTEIDESSINGESLPKEKTVGDEVFGSTINGSGTFIMKVTKEAGDTVFAKILNVVNASQSSMTKTATLLERLEPKYVTLVLGLFPIVLLVGRYIFEWSWQVSLYRSMVYLISVSPCALAASAIPVTLATISNLSRHGVLVKGGAYLSKLNDIKAVLFDKTGTLTNGSPVVTEYDFDDESILKIVVAMEKQANHPLAKAIVEKFSYCKEEIELDVENKVGIGLVAKYDNSEYHIAKPIFFENVSEKWLVRERKLAQEGNTVVFVAKDLEIVGLIALMDTPKEESEKVVSYFKKQGIKTIMITGDAKHTGNAVGKCIGIDEIHANVMPEDKSRIVEEQKEKYGSVMMVGDGINDAPALVTADVGVAMGEGTGVAIDVADLVLMKNSLSKLSYAHKLSKKMVKVTYQNIIFAMLVVIVLVTLNFLGKMGITLGVILHEGSTLLVILNALRMLRNTTI